MIMNDALISEKMEIKDNTFARQFETLIDGKLISVEYFERYAVIAYLSTVSVIRGEKYV